MGGAHRAWLMGPIGVEEVNALVRGSIFENRLLLFERVESTNAVGKELAGRGEPEGAVVVAEEQTRGRGRLGRSWVSPAHVNLLFSLLLRPVIPVEAVFSVTMALAVAVAETVERLCDVAVALKWPNDLFIGDKKAGGILSEFGVHGRRIAYVVAGLGLNVNWRVSESRQLGSWATSLLEETGREWSRGLLLGHVLKGFEVMYGRLGGGGSGEIHRRWQERLMMKGQEVEIRGQAELIRGTMVGVEPDGALRLRDHEGRLRRVVCGDVSLRAV